LSRHRRWQKEFDPLATQWLFAAVIHSYFKYFSRLAIAACWVIALSVAPGAEPKSSPALHLAVRDISFRQEVQRAIDRGLAWLQTQQNSNGWWSTPDHPAITALALTAFHGEPNGRYAAASFVKQGRAFLVSLAKPDGGIYQRDLANYNTGISMMALLSAHGTEYDETLRKARGFLVHSQIDMGEKGRLDTPLDGGVGYGSKYDHSDLNNTLVSLEALYHSKRLVQDIGGAESTDLNWQAAIHFLQSCQNLPSHNREAWASDSPANKGGFIYYPGQSMAGAITNSTTGRVAYRSYGSASYAGLLSFIYADLKPDDARVAAVKNWLSANYTLEENPGMGAQGHYYYLHLLTKALTLLGQDEFTLKDGRRFNWRREAALKIMNLQQRDGSWVNENARWWEKDAALVTSYMVISLELLHRGL
jgi:squalene-hopene/tetraprenyl-beta-curcumene cyclase